ncbi:TRAP dicarboxylate transporter, DctM subunit [Flexistipes sinusarabici DSM 4947]|uniref:TRAP dicarboxylate transporter, DctM subunit n=1 Tax=Flexistipes sinusarabici (strain ATCC 49648 / DSM 4947 / MAS 10) TaxID=717231 RepID=F8E548_FLESM|nr:TRAP transporter large permease subunit [Flexistipes sinusarabici]AEI15684.1 TRAP dicarboxylate transporter, DctM subunit [Flexistipes sinusarabici DSM 4947]
MSPDLLAIAMFVVLLLAVFLGHPLGFTLGGLGIIFGVIGYGPGAFFILTNKTYGLMTNYVLVAIPLFILMAQFLDKSGVAEDLYESMYIVLGPVRGGLALATIVVSTVFAATTGIIGASVVAMGLLAAPTMLSKGYQKELTAGVITAGGTLGILIPPSIMLVVYGGLIGMSVGKLFLAAFIPGLLLSMLYLLYTFVLCYIRPDYGPPIPMKKRTHTTAQKIGMTMKSMLPPLFLIFAVLGSIAAGVATPTEAAGLGSLGALLLAVVNKRANWKFFKESSYSTLKITCMVMLIFVGANFYTAIFMGLGGGDMFERLLFAVSDNKWVILAVMMIIMFLLGMFVDWLGILLLCVPIFTPIAVGTLGFDPLWFALIVCVNLQMSFLTPPFGYALFYLKGVAPPGMELGHIYRGIIPFVILQVIGLILIISFPELVTWLPNFIMN